MFDWQRAGRALRALLHIGSYRGPPKGRCCNSARSSPTLIRIARAVVSARLSFGPGTIPKRARIPVSTSVPEGLSPCIDRRRVSVLQLATLATTVFIEVVLIQCRRDVESEFWRQIGERAR